MANPRLLHPVMTVATATTTVVLRGSLSSVELAAEVLTKRWHKDVNRGYKRMWLAFKDSHTLLSGWSTVALQATRAQTVRNSSIPRPRDCHPVCSTRRHQTALVINPVKIVVNGAFCAFICIPVMLIFAWLFQPMIFVRFGGWVLQAFLLAVTSISALSSGYARRSTPGSCR